MKSTTKVVFLWHMHQPYYKLPEKKLYVLPWVRLHAVKDYYGMAKLIDKFDKVKVVFNFSGVLLEQLLDYVNNHAEDYYLLLTLKDPSYLDKKEKDFILERFFSVNFERFIRPNLRYLQLYNKKLSKKKFTNQEIQDLQVLFNLCWFHPLTFNEDRNLKELAKKGRYYTDEDKKYIINKQYEVISEVIPLYKRLLKNKRIELTITPYHHPILPLIYDTDILREFPYLKKPVFRFGAPSDGIWHLKEAKTIFKKIFGYFPSGSWPAEGSVSEDVISLYKEENFNWIATDEAILFKSFVTDYVSYDMIKNQRHLIYQPYKFRGTNLFFRDRNLSDAISFIYQGWEDPVFAANDLLEHFKRIHYYTKEILKGSIITIIMDGENAWEYYKNNGVEFLETIYSALEKSHILSTTTPTEFLRHYESKNIDRVAPGSWINGDFGVWIGSKKNNFYWYILKRIRDLIEKSKLERKKIEKIRNYFYIIEGSDWFWWNTFEDISGDFKKIFFSYVKKIYSLLDRKIPSYIIKNEKMS
jgi:alpha-amylase/alpha-mannosidase (GH57 family)